MYKWQPKVLYFTVYFKRSDDRKWRVQEVLGQDGQQVLVKYSSNYVTVHTCRLSLEKNNSHNSDTQQAISPKYNNFNESNNFNSENNSYCSNTIYDFV